MIETPPGTMQGEPKPVDLRALNQAARQALGEAQQHLQKGEKEQAQAAYRRAQASAPDDPTVPYVMSGMLRHAGQPMPALTLSLNAWHLAPQDPSARLALATGFRGARFTQASPQVIQALLALYVAPDVSAQELTVPTLSLLRANPTMQSLLEAAGEREALIALLDDQEQAKAVNVVFAEPLTRALMGRALVPDPAFEALFTALRRLLLARVTAGQALPLSPGNVATLALQADMTGYAWSQSDDEAQLVDALILGDDWDSARLVRALYRRPDPAEALPSEPLAGGPDTAPLASLHQRHYLEPLHEARLASTMLRFGDDEEETNAAVFPRWRSLSRQPPRPLPQVLAESLPLLPPNEWPACAEPQVLVAGCGTGGTAVRASSRYAGAKVLALDSDMQTLCYARRQAEAIGSGDITFALASLESLAGETAPNLPGAPFDVVECPSWLQFTADPAAGLAALVRQTAPQGFLRLGFYREAAQQVLRTARDRLLQLGPLDSAADLRRARQELLAMPDEEPAKLVVRGLDFYDLAGMGGLLNQAAAKGFTLDEVAALLTGAGLEFLGFELPDRRIYAAFRQHHSDPAAAKDLSLWATLEAEQPQIFLQAYQLWARPTAS